MYSREGYCRAVSCPKARCAGERAEAAALASVTDAAGSALPATRDSDSDRLHCLDETDALRDKARAAAAVGGRAAAEHLRAVISAAAARRATGIGQNGSSREV